MGFWDIVTTAASLAQSALRAAGPSITIKGASADQAHDAMHDLDIPHHAFHNFNGMNLIDTGEFGIMARGSNKVTIPLHGYAAKDVAEVARKLKAYNPDWEISY